MVPGLRGRLVSHAYVEQQLLPALARSGPDAVHTAAARRLGQWWRRVNRALGPASSARAILDVAVAPMLAILGYGTPALSSHEWGLDGSIGPSGTALVVLPWSRSPDSAWTSVLRAGLASSARWALVTNGHTLRIVDLSRAWTRHSVEFHLGAALSDEKGVAALLELASAPAVTGEAAVGRSLAAVIAESDRFSARVCQSLGNGVLAALPQLTQALSARPRGDKPSGLSGPGESPFDQALTVIYRVLFLLFAEARGLVPIWNDVYREAYTIDALCRRVIERPGAPGLWASLQAISRMAHSGCRAGDLDVTAFNGRLFSPSQTPLADRHLVPDSVAQAVVLALATIESPTGRHRIAYHDLGVEQLGSVYERVLEHEPARPPSPGAPARQAGRTIVLTKTSTERKSTGSFYTPRALTEFLVRRTLHPLVDGRTADEILSLRVVDPAMGSGAFLVAACLYLADQCEHASVRDGDWHAGEVTMADRIGLRRAVAERCLYGVDVNPTAVQLARLSLWLTTLASDRPLTFLDHHLAVGDSLIGARLPDLAGPPRATPSRSRRAVPQLPLFEDDVAHIARERVLPERIRLALQPSDTLDAVRAKERTLAALTGPDGPFAKWSAAADAWCAASLWPGSPPSRALVAEGLAGALGAATTLPRAQIEHWLAEARSIARRHAVFHWELSFPEVFFDAAGRPRPDGGFDAVMGNPPWDMLRADTGSAGDRRSDRDRTASLLRFFRSSGTYGCQGSGHPNRYQLFLERAWQLARPEGRWGMILPSGIATDHGSALLRRRLFERHTVDTWLGFDNRQAIFPIHRSVRFVVMAGTNGGSTERLDMRCGLQHAGVLERLPSSPNDGGAPRPICVTRSRLEAWDPDHLTVPEITCQEALGILTHAAEVAPRLSSAEGWGARFGRELNATDDRPHFVARPHPSALPIVEGKHLRPFRVGIDETTAAIPRAIAERLIDSRTSFDRVRLAYRDVASATNAVTLIAALLPRHTLSTHTLFCLKTPLDLQAQWCLLALLNSLVANYLVRLHVTTHVTTALMARLPVPRPSRRSSACRELTALARVLAATGIDAAPDAYARLNAVVAELYQLSSGQYEHIVSSFPLLSNDLRQRCLQTHKQATEARKGLLIAR
ncbi:MAG: hypothetical protein A3J29_18000 [Acidobacteria bacterium RIFCSPLOWO2_12_FULL_67_14b]|nr:MAG: hypothetical protein A3J29_18000 [Acidobacteria bacterium RIFCSPLOWO2_12_FULL_67_14b]